LKLDHFIFDEIRITAIALKSIPLKSRCPLLSSIDNERQTSTGQLSTAEKK
jgi:hypothetical protein